MVDLNKHAIDHVDGRYPNVKAECSDILSWCKENQDNKFYFSIAFCGLCYLDIFGAAEYLKWIYKNVKY